MVSMDIILRIVYLRKIEYMISHLLINLRQCAADESAEAHRSTLSTDVAHVLCSVLIEHRTHGKLVVW